MKKGDLAILFFVFWFIGVGCGIVWRMQQPIEQGYRKQVKELTEQRDHFRAVAKTKGDIVASQANQKERGK